MIAVTLPTGAACHRGRAMEWTPFDAPGMELAGLSADYLAHLVRVHVDTARRWKRAGKLPAHVAELLQLKVRGDLGVLDPAWAGWHLLRGQLWSPEEWPSAPGEIRAMPYRAAQLAELERQAQQPRQWELELLLNAPPAPPPGASGSPPTPGPHRTTAASADTSAPRARRRA